MSLRQRTEPDGSSIDQLPARITPGVVLGRELKTHVDSTEYGETMEFKVHQEQALKTIIAALEKGQRKGYVELATATGKTYIMSRIVDAAAALGMRTLILTPTKKIADQLYGENGEKGLGRFTNLLEDKKVGRRYGEHNNYKKHDTVISSYQAMNWFANNESMDDFDLIIGDEAHMSLGDVTSKNIDKYCPRAIKLGFTATPAYSSERSVDKIWGDPLYKLDIREAIDTGLTPAVRSLVYQTGTYIETLDPGRSDFTQQELNQLVTVKQRNDAIMSFSKSFVNDGQQGAVACLPGADHGHARYVAEQLSTQVVTINGTTRMIRAQCVGSHQSDETNQKILEAYDNKEIDVLTFVKALELGWDSQRPSFLINASPTTSIVRESQLLGRLLRGDDDVTFVDFLDDSQKRQITSLHVLGEMTVDSERRLGGTRGNQTVRTTLNGYLGYMFDVDIYGRLANVDGITISDLYFKEGQSEDQQLQAKYDSILTKEGLPADLPPGLITVPEVARRALGLAVRSLGPQADLQQITDYAIQNDLLKAKTSVEDHVRDLVAAAYANAQLEAIDDYEVSVVSDPNILAVEDRDLFSRLNNVLDSESFSEREARIVRMRFGIGDNQSKTLDDIGDVFGISRARVRQLESLIMPKLRHASRSDQLRSDPPEFENPAYADLSPNTLRLLKEKGDAGLIGKVHKTLRGNYLDGEVAALNLTNDPKFSAEMERSLRNEYAQTHLRLKTRLSTESAVDLEMLQRTAYIRGFINRLDNFKLRVRESMD